MLQRVNKNILLGVALLGFNVSAQAVDVHIWQVPEASKGKAPIFYQEASKSSKIISTFKPNQTVQILSQQKDWVKIAALDNSGQIAWLPLEGVKDITKVKVDLYQTPNNYRCNVFIYDPEGRERGNWHVTHAHHIRPRLDKKEPSAKEQEEFETEFLRVEKAFKEQWDAMSKLMGHLFPVMVVEPEASKNATEEAKTLPVEPQKKEVRSAKKETILEENKSVTT